MDYTTNLFSELLQAKLELYEPIAFAEGKKVNERVESDCGMGEE